MPKASAAAAGLARDRHAPRVAAPSRMRRKPVDIVAKICAIIAGERSVHPYRGLASRAGPVRIGGADLKALWPPTFFLKGFTMPKAIELIVDVYVRYQNRRALGDLMVHRQRLVASLRGRPNVANFDFSRVLGQLDHEVAVIQRGIEALVARGDRERGLAA